VALIKKTFAFTKDRLSLEVTINPRIKMPIDKISLGNKLRRCRENLNLDLSEVAKRVGFLTTKFQMIENGIIEPTGDEILILADFYKQDFKYFISNEKLSSSEQVEVFYRKFGDEFSKEDRFAIQEFMFLCENEELIEGINLKKSFNITISTSKGISKEQGVEAAKKLRSFLGYSGKQIYKDIYSEFRKIGIHVFRRKLSNTKISGLFIKHPIAGKCILVNYSDDIYRQNFTIAHEVAHALLDNDIEYNLSFKKEEADYREYRANAFASSFLVPEEAFDTSNKIEWTDSLIIDIANKLKVNIQTLLIALSNYKKISESEYKRFLKLKVPVCIKEDFELRNLTEKRIKDRKQIVEKGLSDYYINKCYLAYTNGNISAGKLAEILLIRDSELPELLDIFNLKLRYDN